MTLQRCGKPISGQKTTFEWDAHIVEHYWPYINKTLLSANQYNKSRPSNTVPAFCSGYRQAQLSHLTDIWSISAPIALFIFCSMWVEKTFRYHWDSHSPQLDHSPPAGDVKYHDLIICADLILSSWRHEISFKETLPVETLCRFFVTAALSQAYIHLNNAEAQHHNRLWSPLRGNEREMRQSKSCIINVNLRSKVWLSSSDLMLVRHAFWSSNQTD